MIACDRSFHGGHVSLHIAHVIVDKVESISYCIVVDILNMTLHVFRSSSSTVDLSHCTLHMSWWTKQKVYKLIILYSEHHTAECLVAYATVESSYCIVDILNITLHISRSTYSTVDMSHCTLHMHKVHTVHSFKINMFHGGHVSLNIAHVVYYIILHSSGHIERRIAHIKIF